MENMVTGVCALIVAIVCILGVFSDFKDTTVQRVALGFGCVASTGVAFDVLRGYNFPGSIDLLMWCLAAHCIEAARKFWKAK
jgi:hypothetical protein